MVAKRIEFILLLVYLITNLINLNKIYISSDHAGFKLKEKIKYSLKKKKFKIFDLGPSNDNSVDYPDFAHKLAQSIEKKENKIGKIVVLYVQNTQEEKWLKSAVKGLTNVNWVDLITEE